MSFASQVYWARSPTNAGAWVPCVLMLDNGQLSLVSDQRTEFECPVSSLKVQATRLGSLQISRDSVAFTLSAVGGALVPFPSTKLLQLLSDFREGHPGLPRESRVDVMAQWTHILENAGANVQSRRRSPLRALFIGCVVTVVLVFVLLVVAIVLAAAH